MTGVMIAQLYRLQHRENPSPVFGYFVLSTPLSMIFQSAALIMILLGCIRFWRQQSAMAVGKMHAGGWELIVIAIGSFLVSICPAQGVKAWSPEPVDADSVSFQLLLMMFAVHVGIDVYKTEYNQP